MNTKSLELQIRKEISLEIRVGNGGQLTICDHSASITNVYFLAIGSAYDILWRPNLWAYHSLPFLLNAVYQSVFFNFILRVFPFHISGDVTGYHGGRVNLRSICALFIAFDFSELLATLFLWVRSFATQT
jgi:hypothetical protein